MGAKSVETTKTYGKMARGRYNKRVKPVITSQAMLQSKGCHLEGCVHEYSGVIRQFCGKKRNKVLHNPFKYLYFTGSFVDFLTTYTQ